VLETYRTPFKIKLEKANVANANLKVNVKNVKTIISVCIIDRLFFRAMQKNLQRIGLTLALNNY